MLATGSTDARVNLYHITAVAPPRPTSASQPSLLPLPVAAAGTPANREIGTLSHHESTITNLCFPSRSKLLSASSDSTVAVTRTHDWFKMSSFKAPVPRAAGRPSGDTAAAGDVPAGINAFAVHPSQRLMLSVGEGDKSMRLWNMLTGRREGQLEFPRALLAAVGASRWRGAEGRRIVWSDDGIEFAVAFERGVVVYGLDLEARGVAKPAAPACKICEVRYLARRGVQGNVLALSTEDGRVLFYGTDEASLDVPVAAATATAVTAVVADNNNNSNDAEPAPVRKRKPADVAPPFFKPLAHLGPLPTPGTRGSRIKDFVVLRPADTSAATAADDGDAPHNADEDVDGDNIQLSVPDVYHVVTATSEGTVKVWSLRADELDARLDVGDAAGDAEVGTLLGSYETGRRVTCLEGFVMEEEGDAVVVRDDDVLLDAPVVVAEGVMAAAGKTQTAPNGQNGAHEEEEGEFGGFSDEE